MYDLLAGKNRNFYHLNPQPVKKMPVFARTTPNRSKRTG